MTLESLILWLYFFWGSLWLNFLRFKSLLSKIFLCCADRLRIEKLILDMTNEEFAAMKAADTQFIEAVARMFSEFCVELKGEKLKRFITTPLGGYLWKTNHIISEINQNLDDIRLA